MNKRHIGKRKWLHIKVNNKDLFFLAKIIDVTNTHISFIDKFNIEYSFRLLDVIEAKPIK